MYFYDIDYEKEELLKEMAMRYVNEESMTLRKLATQYPYKKSYIHILFHDTLPKIDRHLYYKVIEKSNNNVDRGRVLGGKNSTKKR